MDGARLQANNEGLRLRVAAVRRAKEAGHAPASSPKVFAFLWQTAAGLAAQGDVEAAGLVSEMASLREPAGDPLQPGQCRGCGAFGQRRCADWCAVQSARQCAGPPPVAGCVPGTREDVRCPGMGHGANGGKRVETEAVLVFERP